MQTLGSVVCGPRGLKFLIDPGMMFAIMQRSEAERPGITKVVLGRAERIFYLRAQVFSLTFCALMAFYHPWWFSLLIACIAMGTANVVLFALLPTGAARLAQFGGFLILIHVGLVGWLIFREVPDGSRERYFWITYFILEVWFSVGSSVAILLGRLLFSEVIQKLVKADLHELSAHTPTYFLMCAITHAERERVRMFSRNTFER